MCFYLYICSSCEFVYIVVIIIVVMARVFAKYDEKGRKYVEDT